MNSIDSLQTLATRLADFVDARDWDQFHNPKNLAMALTAEAGELLEHFQWLRADEAETLSQAQREAVALEMADILMFLVRLADKLGVNLAPAEPVECGCEELPPLPETNTVPRDYFTADQMREFARAAIAAHDVKRGKVCQN